LPAGIGPERVDLFDEFMIKPFGRHTPDLQALLAHMRGSSIHGKHFLLMIEPHSRWALARFSERPPLRAELIENVVFDDIEVAERHVFSLRWMSLFGSVPSSPSSGPT
jgi:hypothetical protein